MMLFAISLMALAAGPLLVPVLTRARWAARALDAFILVGIGGLVFVHILPHSIEEAGLGALGAMVVGLMVPFLAERLGDPELGAKDRLAAGLGLAALAVHGLLDGVGLAAPAQGADGGMLVAATVLLHRLPASLAIWWMVKPRFGTRGAIVALVSIALASAVGYAAAGAWHGLFEGHMWYVLQAFLVGALVHVVVHQSTGSAALDPRSRWQPASALGAAVAVAALAFMGSMDLHANSGGHGMAEAFMGLALASAPPLVAAYVIATLLHVTMPERLVGFVRARSIYGQALRGTLLGLPLNVCSCAVTPMYRSMIGRGIPPAAAMAFLVAAPEVGVASVLLSFRLLGIEIGLVRLALALLMGLAVGLWMGVSQGASSRAGDDHETDVVKSLGGRLRVGLDTGLVELSDHTLPWLLVGLGVAALADSSIDPGDLSFVPGLAQVPLAAIVGTPAYVCATGSTPLMAVLVLKGLTPGAAIAFLVTGQVTNPATRAMLAALHGKRTATIFSVVIAAAAVAAGWLVDLVHPAGSRGTLGGFEHGTVQAVNWACLAILGTLMGVSLLRQGVPGFVAQVLSLHGHGHHAHHHHDLGHGHEHDLGERAHGHDGRQ